MRVLDSKAGLEDLGTQALHHALNGRWPAASCHSTSSAVGSLGDFIAAETLVSSNFSEGGSTAPLVWPAVNGPASRLRDELARASGLTALPAGRKSARQQCG